MKCYFSYFKLKFITGLQYRTSALAGIFTQFVFGLINIMVFLAFFESGSNGSPMTLEQTASYYWLNQIFFALINQFYRDKELFELIRSGNISYELARPQNLYFMWFFKIYGSRLAMVTLRSIPLIIVSLFLPKPFNLGLPSSWQAFVLFVIALFIGSFLVTAIITFYPILTLKTLNEKGVVQFIISIADLLSGLAIPIPFFPKMLRTISSILPFQYISDLSFRIYVGNIDYSFALIGIAIQIIWLIILVFISYLLLNKSLKRVVVQGG